MFFITEILLIVFNDISLKIPLILYLPAVKHIIYFKFTFLIQAFLFISMNNFQEIPFDHFICYFF
jgi:hypothetical protein